MRSGQKSELVQLLEASTTVECPDVDVNVFDAAAVVNMLPPEKTFKDYATSVFLNYVILKTSTEYQKNRFDTRSILRKQPKAEYKGGERLGSTKAHVR